MFVFKRMRSVSDASFSPVSRDTPDEELRKRIDALSEDEFQVCKWIVEYYSERWIAETLLVSKARLREIMRELCVKLGVANLKEMRRIYGGVGAFAKSVVITDEIDAYVEARTEKEIREKLSGEEKTQ